MQNMCRKEGAIHVQYALNKIVHTCTCTHTTVQCMCIHCTLDLQFQVITFTLNSCTDHSYNYTQLLGLKKGRHSLIQKNPVKREQKIQCELGTRKKSNYHNVCILTHIPQTLLLNRFKVTSATKSNLRIVVCR